MSTAVRWAWLLPAYASLFLLGLNENVRGPIFPEQLRELGLSDAEGGWLFAIASAGVALGSLVGRHAVARLGALRWQWGSLLVMAAGVAVTALAGGLTLLLFGCALFGLGGGGLMVTQNLLASEGVPPAYRQRALNGLHAMYGLASLLAPLVVAALASAGLGWRECLWLLAALTGALGLAHLALTPDPPRAGARGQGSGGWRGQLVALIGALYVTSELLISTRLVLLVRRDGHDQETAAFALTAFFACLLAGRLLFSLWRWPWSNRALLGISALGALACYLGGLIGPPWLLIPAGFFMAPFFPTVVDLVAREFPRAVDGVLARTFATVSTSLVLAHWGVGVLTDRFDLRSALFVGPAALVLLLVLLVLLPRAASPTAPA
jgi:MFS family permease